MSRCFGGVCHLTLRDFAMITLCASHVAKDEKIKFMSGKHARSCRRHTCERNELKGQTTVRLPVERS